MYVIGTAGHVDHGKSTLIKALTGIHPDRLKEEKLRQMTIDLGFAWLELPDGEELGIVDVPGHRDFIENMLSGVGGIDAALFIIAADEGVMPQTKEHLAILDLLQVKNGIIVITKIDLVDDPDWLDLVEMDVHDAVKGTVLEHARIVRVSAYTKAGIDALIKILQELLAEVKPKPDFDRARLPIDRVFSITGFGTIVTGTLLDGSLKVGEEVELLPGRKKVRIRGLQTHKKNEQIASPGSRTAVNLTGINVDEIQRGQVIASLKKYQPTQRFDADLRILPSSSFSIKHNQTVKLFIGASEVLSRIRVLGQDEIKPGETGWVQVEPAAEIVGIRGDRFIIRIPSPGETIGGGMIVNPNPSRRHKRFSEVVIKQLEAYKQGTPDEIFLQSIQDVGVGAFDMVAKKAKLESSIIREFWTDLIEGKQIYQLEKGDVFQKPGTMICSFAWLMDKQNKTSSLLENYHHQYNLRSGIPKEELKSRLKLDQPVFLAVLNLFQEINFVETIGNVVRLKAFSPNLNDSQQKAQESILKSFSAMPYSTPGIKESIENHGEEIFNYLQSENILINVGNDVAFLSEYYHEMKEWVVYNIEQSESLTVAEFRDKFQTSRKYALAFLEHLDAIGITIRDGDVRKIRQSWK
ncbi:MAG: selenocysteine-specific translation elongation factor [Anaerolineaceae bacterium]|jgi:selenocysteine-specific elongation factor|nr:selenocysteine-specific translation elongation factor [Anaerolineaceae bacterium]